MQNSSMNEHVEENVKANAHLKDYFNPIKDYSPFTHSNKIIRVTFAQLRTVTLILCSGNTNFKNEQSCREM